MPRKKLKWHNETRKVKDLVPYEFNPRSMDDATRAKLRASMEKFNLAEIPAINTDDKIVAGHQRVQTLAVLGRLEEEIDVRVPNRPLTESEFKEYNLISNRLKGSWVDNLLREHFPADLMARGGFSEGEINLIHAEMTQGASDVENEMAEAAREQARKSLSERFIIPPFSIFDTRKGYWQERKRKWIELGIRSEIGRGGNLLNFSDTVLEPDPEKRKAKKMALPTNGEAQISRSGDSLEDETYRAKNKKSDSIHIGAWLQSKGEKTRGGKRATSINTQEWVQANTESGLASNFDGTSIFDPVLTEICYKWFCKPSGIILDPFAGGSVRGIVAGYLGFDYRGYELSGEQVEANRQQSAEILGEENFKDITDPDELTPIEPRGDYFVKRDDYFIMNGIRGGKVRACIALAKGAKGLSAASNRKSPQSAIVAVVAASLGIPCRIHTARGETTNELAMAEGLGAEIIRHKVAYNSNIKKKAREDAEAQGWVEIPFGMISEVAPETNKAQAANVPSDTKRIVVPVGSGMSLAGILRGLDEAGLSHIPILGVAVGADPKKTLSQFYPDWESRVELVTAKIDYHERPEKTRLEGLPLDPIYEAKCIPFLKAGDLLWVVGIRPSEAMTQLPKWVTGDSLKEIRKHPIKEKVDLVFSCPPYFDLEQYSDDPSDLSNMSYDKFKKSYRAIIQLCAERLNEDSFAVFTVGEIRDEKGFYRGFVPETIEAFKAAGMHFYNEIILINTAGSLPIRVARPFEATRKVGKCHQQVLVFFKGDPGKIREKLGPVDVSEIDQPSATDEIKGA
jgi:1-aminocyclopropane-1-carboxylate deaminase/D-cysteine desulfhydrase-like pyridoxal-dependent ACC family enzyme/DNA modification methylase